MKREKDSLSETTPNSISSFTVPRHAARAQPSIYDTVRRTNDRLSYHGLGVKTIETVYRLYLHQVLETPTLSSRDRHQGAWAFLGCGIDNRTLLGPVKQPNEAVRGIRLKLRQVSAPGWVKVVCCLCGQPWVGIIICIK